MWQQYTLASNRNKCWVLYVLHQKCFFFQILNDDHRFPEYFAQFMSRVLQTCKTVTDWIIREETTKGSFRLEELTQMVYRRLPTLTSKCLSFCAFCYCKHKVNARRLNPIQMLGRFEPRLLLPELRETGDNMQTHRELCAEQCKQALILPEEWLLLLAVRT